MHRGSAGRGDGHRLRVVGFDTSSVSSTRRRVQCADDAETSDLHGDAGRLCNCRHGIGSAGLAVSKRRQRSHRVRLQRVRLVRLCTTRDFGTANGRRSIQGGIERDRRRAPARRFGVFQHRRIRRDTCRDDHRRRRVRPCAKLTRRGPRWAPRIELLEDAIRRRSAHRVDPRFGYRVGDSNHEQPGIRVTPATTSTLRGAVTSFVAARDWR
jgi:hypothetical protein